MGHLSNWRDELHWSVVYPVYRAGTMLCCGVCVVKFGMWHGVKTTLRIFDGPFPKFDGQYFYWSSLQETLEALPGMGHPSWDQYHENGGFC